MDGVNRSISDTLLQLWRRRYISMSPQCGHYPVATGYSRDMDKSVILMLSLCTAVAALAQDATPSPDLHSDMQVNRQQKRLELRAAVSSASRSGVPVMQASDATPTGHHMSVKDRAEMREQLRTYQPAPRPAPPAPRP